MNIKNYKKMLDDCNKNNSDGTIVYRKCGEIVEKITKDKKLSLKEKHDIVSYCVDIGVEALSK